MSASNDNLNANYGVSVVMHGASMPWVPSPNPLVLRRRMELIGPTEAGCVTSIVEYKPESRFHKHDHPGGEEIIVLSGVFQDERGSFPAGSYMLNPTGFQHEPYSTHGCILFVKLRQYWGDKVVSLNWRDDASSWSNISSDVTRLILMQSSELLEQACLLRLHPSPASSTVTISLINAFAPDIIEAIHGGQLLADGCPIVAHVAEIFVVQGSCCVHTGASGSSTATTTTASEGEEKQELKELSWMRIPYALAGSTSVSVEFTEPDATTVLYVKLSARRI